MFVSDHLGGGGSIFVRTEKAGMGSNGDTVRVYWWMQQKRRWNYKRPRDIHHSQRVFIHPSHTLKSFPNVTLSRWPLKTPLWHHLSWDVAPLISERQRGCFSWGGGRWVLFWGGGTAQPCLSTPRTTTRGPVQQEQQPWRSDLRPPQAPGFCWPASQPWNSPMTLCLWHLGFPPKHTTNTKKPT